MMVVVKEVKVVMVVKEVMVVMVVKVVMVRVIMYPVRATDSQTTVCD